MRTPELWDASPAVGPVALISRPLRSIGGLFLFALRQSFFRSLGGMAGGICGEDALDDFSVVWVSRDDGDLAVGVGFVASSRKSRRIPVIRELLSGP